MSKYTTEQLQEMAHHVICRPPGFDSSSNLLYALLETKFKLTQDEVARRIHLLAVGCTVH